jgi:hypothetical protein
MHVFLVHGTFPQRPEQGSVPWCHEGSIWLEQLKTRLQSKGVEATFETIEWAGSNSETERFVTGFRLRERFLQCGEKEEIDYAVIAHSHGGSIVWHALLGSVASPQVLPGLLEWVRTRRRRHSESVRYRFPRELNHLKKWVTIGTPFLIPAERSWIAARWRFAAACLFLLTSPITLLLLLASGSPQWLDSATLVVVGIEASLLMAGSLAARRARRLASYQAHYDAAVEASVVYGKRWLGIWCRHDEALVALRSSLQLVGWSIPGLAGRLVRRRTAWQRPGDDSSVRRAVANSFSR